jgi:hypothetical protein
MKITLIRIYSNSVYTFGMLYINGIFECYTLEDEKRAIKVYAETRIPAGRYIISLHESSRFIAKYKKTFNGHQGMLLLNNVVGFSGILIHIGNTDVDTAGCILVGRSHEIGKNMIGSSAVAYNSFYFKVLDAIRSGETITIHVQDESFMQQMLLK